MLIIKIKPLVGSRDKETRRQGDKETRRQGDKRKFNIKKII